MRKKKGHTPLQSDNEQKNMHIKILIGAMIITVIIVIFAVTSQFKIIIIKVYYENMGS